MNKHKKKYKDKKYKLDRKLNFSLIILWPHFQIIHKYKLWKFAYEKYRLVYYSITGNIILECKNS